MKRLLRKIAASAAVVAMLLPTASLLVQAAPALPQAPSEAETTVFSTSFETTDSDGFLQSQPDMDENDNPRMDGVSGSANTLPVGDITRFVQLASIQGSSNYNTNETKEKIFDNNSGSKWLNNTGPASEANPVWVSFSLSEAKVLKAYTMVAANDAEARDPKAWKFSGSADGENWVLLDTQADVRFTARYQAREFEFENETAYQHYKLEITANYGNGGMTQFADLNISTKNPDDSKDEYTPMYSVLGTGPASTWNQSANRGWRGARALEVRGAQFADTDGGYAYNVLFEDMNIPVTEKTRLKYVIFPQFSGNYDYEFTSMYVAVDLKFTDGTYLSQSNAVDQNGTGMNPLAQGQSKILTFRQWNEIFAVLGSDPALVGKTIDKILVGFHSDKTPEANIPFQAYIDDIRITETAPMDYEHLSDYVNTLRGTNGTGSFSRGLTVPGTTVPHGFNFFAPVTNSGSNTLYEYQHTSMKHITFSHEPSIWVGDRGTWQFMVNTSISAGSTSMGVNQREATFSHDNEIAKAHYYSVEFTEGNAANSRLEVAPTMHGAAVRFTFKDGAANRNVILDNVRSSGGVTFDAATQSFTATSNHTGNGMKAMYVYGVFDKAYTSPVTSGNAGMASFPGEDEVTLYVASSFISAEQAKKNLEMELAGKSFDDVFEAAQGQWDEVLGRVEIEGASEEQMVTFYSNMYRLYMYPNLLSEQTGEGEKDGWQYKSPYSNNVVDGKLYYNNGFWDTYRTTWAAYALFTPEHDTELLDGLIQHYIDQGRIPRWIAPGGTNSMVGTSSDVILGDALLRGIEFDVENGFKSTLRNAAVYSSNLTQGGRKNLETSIFEGFTAGADENMSWSLEGYINDYGIAMMAEAMGLEDEYVYYINRAQNYAHLFNQDGNWFQGVNSDGSWRVSNLNPISWGADYTETNAWNMAFTAPQDGAGLAALYGGKDMLADKLDEFFTMHGDYVTGGYGGVIHEMLEAREIKLGQYGHSNQPSHHIPYMYLYAGRPDRTQEVVRDVMDRIYVGSSLGQGYIGDEDNGEMSAWYILSALGLYPMNMGSGQFVIGSPLFTKATVHMDNGGTLTINAPNNSKENIYVQGVKLNGEDYSKTYIDHKDILNGGTIDFDMGPNPSTWGTADEDLPPSINEDGVEPNPAMDLTAKGTFVLGAPMTNGAAPNSAYSASATSLANLFDNNSGTNATLAATEGTASLYYKVEMPTRLELYTLTSTSAQNAMPTGIKVYGSNDLDSWALLDERTGESWEWGRYTRPFAVDQTGLEKYSYYRLDLTGGDSFQMAEVELMGDSNATYDLDYLLMMIEQAKQIDTSAIHPALAAELAKAIEEAEATAQKPGLTEEEITEAVELLRTAIARAGAVVRSAYENPFEAESFDEANGIVKDPDSSRSGGYNIGGVQPGEWTYYKNVDFGATGAVKFGAEYAASNINNEAQAGFIDVILDALDGPVVASLPTHQTGAGWQNYVYEEIAVDPAITGLHDVYLQFRGPGAYVANVDYIVFTEAGSTKADLQALYDQVKNLKEADYTADSWATFAPALAAAAEVLADEDATAAEILAAYNGLNTAFQDLATRGDVGVLSIFYDSFAKLVESDSTAASWAPFKAAMEAAKALIDAPQNAAQTAVEAALTELITTRNNLKDAVSTGPLAEAIRYAEALLEDKDQYIEASVTKLEAALEKAKAVLELPEEERTAQVVTQATMDLLDVVRVMFEKGDLRALAALVASAKRVDETKFTPASWAAVATALAEAEALLVDPDALQDEADAAYSKLSNAIRALVAAANPSGLETAMSVAKSILDNASQYVPASIEGLQALYDQAALVLADKNAAQTAVDEMAQQLLAKAMQARKPANKSLLKASLGRAGSVSGQFSQASTDALAAAMAEAEKLARDGNATQEQIDAAQAAVEAALAGLETKAPEAGVEQAVVQDPVQQSPAVDDTAVPVPAGGDEVKARTKAEVTEPAAVPAENTPAAQEARPVPEQAEALPGEAPAVVPAPAAQDGGSGWAGITIAALALMAAAGYALLRRRNARKD